MLRKLPACQVARAAVEVGLQEEEAVWSAAGLEAAVELAEPEVGGDRSSLHDQMANCGAVQVTRSQSATRTACLSGWMTTAS